MIHAHTYIRTHIHTGKPETRASSVSSNDDTCTADGVKTNAAGESLTAKKVSKLLRSTSEDILVSYIMCVCMYMRL